MDKLKPCPFCGKQIAEIGNCENMEECEHFEECPVVEPYVCVVCSINKGGCGASTGYHDSEEKAIAAWNRRADTENKPLTIDELRQMDGEPVWIVEYPAWGHWELSVDAEEYLEDREEAFYNMKHDDPSGKYGLHALGWLAYRQKVGVNMDDKTYDIDAVNMGMDDLITEINELREENMILRVERDALAKSICVIAEKVEKIEPRGLVE